MLMSRMETIASLIPRDCDGILDVGCGDGRITNNLAPYCRNNVIGLEINWRRVQYVKEPKVIGTAAYLPFRDKSIDLLLVAETLEHLPCDVYQSALHEIERVARRFILVVVPYNEDIPRALIVCPYCGCHFHPSWHLRSYSEGSLAHLFDNFVLHAISRGEEVAIHTYPHIMLRIAGALDLLPRRQWPRAAMCPQCNYHLPDTDKAMPSSTSHTHRSLLHSLISVVARPFSLKRKGWGHLAAMYYQGIGS